MAGLQEEASRVAAALGNRGLRALVLDEALYPLFVRVYLARATAHTLREQSLLLRQRARLERWKRRASLLGAAAPDPNIL